MSLPFLYSENSRKIGTPPPQILWRTVHSDFGFGTITVHSAERTKVFSDNTLEHHALIIVYIVYLSRELNKKREIKYNRPKSLPAKDLGAAGQPRPP
jgi:hypothetical protein